jgi:hypothetical protein
MRKHINNIKEKIVENKIFFQGLVTGIVAILIIGAFAFFAIIIASGNLPEEKAGEKVTAYVNTNLLGGQATAKLESISDFSWDLYKLKFTINGQPIDGYMTKNAKLFFAQTFEMSTSTDKAVSANTAEQKPTNITKSDKPKVELFVMSYCPYGTQIEKGILPVLQTLGSKIDFSLKFVDYAMHGEKEMTENLRQYCLDKEQNDKLFPYLACFLKSDDSSSCLNSNGVDQNKLNSCVKNADTQFKVTSQFTNKQNWKGNFPPFDVHQADNSKYGVQGSPTLVINGGQAESARDSSSLLKTICSAFTTEPEVCATAKLSTQSPAPGFGDATAPAGAATNADCATN